MASRKYLYPLLIVVLMVLSWYMLLSDTAKSGAEFDAYLQEARHYAEIGVTKYARDNYDKALELKDDPDIYVEVAEYYREHESGRAYLQWCRSFFEHFPEDPRAYDCLLRAYHTAEDYSSCFDVLETAGRRGVSSAYMEGVAAELAYAFELDYNTFSAVSVFGGGCCAVEADGKWGFVNQFGDNVVSCKYQAAGTYSTAGVAPVVSEQNGPFFIDGSGARIMATNEPYRSFGMFIDERIPAEDETGRYHYLDHFFEPVFGDYLFAGAFNGGLAAAQAADGWHVVRPDGSEPFGAVYKDVVLDEKGIAFRNGRAFVSGADGAYMMIDDTGAQVGSLTFSDALPFFGPGAAAVELNGKWQFVRADGSLVEGSAYEAARSFSNGLAAVCVDGLWGFIDETMQMVIEPQFQDAMYFNEKGSCFVYTGRGWQLLQLYRLNRK